MNRFYLLILLFFLLAPPGFTQNSGDYRVQKFNTENGLPSNGIKGLQWDEETGFLWIATEAGIVRYNGMEFKVYNKDDNPHITSERIIFMVKNNSGKIYSADTRGNLFYVRKNQLQFLETRSVGGDSGNNFISTSVSDVMYRSRVDFKDENYALQYDDVLPIADTATYILHSNNLFYYSQTILSPRPALDNQTDFKKGFKCHENIFLADRNQDIFLFNKFSHALIKVLLPENELLLNGGNLIWENGMKNPILFKKKEAWLLSYEHGKMNASLICNEVPEDVLVRYAQFDDKRMKLFIGTDSKGIIVIEPKRVKPQKAENLPPNQHTSYYSQVELPNGNVLTNEGHIIGKATSDGQFRPIRGRFNMNTLVVGDSILWYIQPDTTLESSPSILCSYNYHAGEKKTYPKVREDYQLVMAISGGDLYVGKNNGIYRLVNDTLEMAYAYDHPKGSQGIDFDMEEISPGILAIASCNVLLRLDIARHKLDTIYGPGNYCVRTIWKYNDYIFFGTYGGGLFAYRNGIAKALPLDKNKYLLFAHCFVKDDHGFCWISTNRGLFKTSISELTDAYEKNTKEVYYYYYGRQDGMEMTELNGGCMPCALVKKDKTISFPTMDGLLWVNPENAIPVLPKGEIYLDNVLVDNQIINPDSSVMKELPSKINEMIFHLAISAWANKENIYVDYKLNEDPNWRSLEVEKGMEIRFNNLQPGDYKLVVRKRNGFGTNNYTFKELSFHINTPWYKKLWSYLVLVVLAGILFRLYFDIRTRQLRMKQRRLELQIAAKTKELQLKNEVLEKNDSIKTRLISIISHDIVTPLKFLTAAGKNLIEKRELMTEELQKETLREVINTSQELQLLSTNILNWIKYQNENRRLAKENFNVHELTHHVLSVLNSLARQKNLALRNDVDLHLVVHQFYEPLKILIYNLVSNAINFTDHGTITIGNSRNGELIIFVQDEGVGMTAEQIQNIMSDQFIVSSANVDNRKGNGLGYLIIKDLLKMMGGSFTIQSEKGKGTVVSIYLKSELITTS